jgi:hypothetical protein
VGNASQLVVHDREESVDIAIRRHDRGSYGPARSASKCGHAMSQFARVFGFLR